eukprot:s5241_g6.t1
MEGVLGAWLAIIHDAEHLPELRRGATERSAACLQDRRCKLGIGGLRRWPCGASAAEELCPTHVAAKSQRRTVPCATASSMCASIASLASKNPGLWKSSRSLARCGGEDFVAALIFTAAGLPTWSRDPKRTLLAALCGNVAHEAAKALQNFWRQSRRRTVSVYQPRPPKEPANGYSTHRVDKASTHHGSFPTPKASPKVYFQDGEARRGRAQQSIGSEKNGTVPAPGAAKKSNPRPVQSRAVPMYPQKQMTVLLCVYAPAFNGGKSNLSEVAKKRRC